MNVKTNHSAFRHLVLFATLTSVLLMSSCNRYFYAPTDALMMGLQEKGDVKVSGGYDQSTIDVFDSSVRRRNLNFQLAVSPIKNIGVQGNYTSFRDSPRNKLSTTEELSEADFTEFAAGYYWIINEGSSSFEKGNQLVWENYLGTGWGQIRYQRNTLGSSELNLNKFFLQSYFYYQYQKNFSIGIAFRPTWVSYQDATITGSYPTDDILDLQSLEALTPIFFFETGFRLQGGWDEVKFFVSSVFSNSSISAQDFIDSNFSHINSVASIGIIIEPDEIFRKAKNKDRDRKRR